MKNKRRIIGIVAATILALIGTVALVSYVQSAKDEAVAQEALVDVYVVDELVPKGAAPETIKSSVSIEQVPQRLKQTGAITDLEAVGDQVAGADLQPGDQLLAARLASRDLVVAEVTDKVQISARLDAERAVGGSLQKGDLVGVYLSFDPFDLDESGQSTEPADDAAPALQVPTTMRRPPPDRATNRPPRAPRRPRTSPGWSSSTSWSPTSRRSAHPCAPTTTATIRRRIAQVTGTQYVVTLALSPEQSERFVFATEFGHVWLSIEPASVEDDGTRVVTLGNVYAVVN